MFHGLQHELFPLHCSVLTSMILWSSGMDLPFLKLPLLGSQEDSGPTLQASFNFTLYCTVNRFIGHPAAPNRDHTYINIGGEGSYSLLSKTKCHESLWAKSILWEEDSISPKSFT